MACGSSLDSFRSKLAFRLRSTCRDAFVLRTSLVSLVMRCRCERCYDVFELSVPKSYKQSDAAHTAKLSPHLENGRVVDPNKHTRKLQRVQGVDSSRFMGQNVDPSTTAHDGTQRYADGDGTQRDVRWLGEAGPGERQGYIQQNSRQETSVHVRMFSIPGSAAW